ncbi:MAG TPA: hypothetical protein VD694_03215 [Nitrososphaeraceae archaeon]|nr:hypothetical protein [Nitrososphaeraceae archaeon]
MKALEWPKIVEQLAEYPDAAAPGWSNELNGVTNDGKNWYITQKDRIWKFPLSFDLNMDIDTDEAHPGVLNNTIPSFYNYTVGTGYYFYDHLGDLDYYQGRLYVALEGHAYDHESFLELPAPSPKIAIYDANSLAFISAADVLGYKTDIVSSCAWCAINPLNGLLFTSDSTPNNNTLRVYMHYLSPDGKLILNFAGYFPLVGPALEQVCGGVFSKNGHLYLVTSRAFFTAPIYDPNTDTWIPRPIEKDGIFGFDMISGRQSSPHSSPL